MEHSLEIMTKDERKLLKKFEEFEVDHFGIIENPRLLTVDDFNTMSRWHDENFIEVEPLAGESIQYRVKLSDEAWKLAHEERKARSERMKKNLKS
jgi:hypothetical protein